MKAVRTDAHAYESVLGDSLLREQIDLETQAVRAGVERYEAVRALAEKRGEAAGLKPVERLLLHWYDPFVAVLEREIKEIRKSDRAPLPQQSIYGPVLMALDPQSIAVVVMNAVVSELLNSGGTSNATRVCCVAGRAVLAESNARFLKKKHRDSWDHLEKMYKRLTAKRINWWTKKTLNDPTTHIRVSAAVGTICVKLLMDVASDADYMQEAFSPAFRMERSSVRHNRFLQKITLTDRCLDIIEEGHRARAVIRPRYRPMVVAPAPWYPGEEGGYIRIRTPLVSRPTQELKAALADADLSRLYECKNAMERTAWRVNWRVMKVMEAVWNEGGDVAGVPASEPEPKPPLPPDFDTNPAAKKAWKRQATLVHRANRLGRSERSLFLSRLHEARDMAQRASIWFPHQLDFRGRTYSIPQPLNHQGPDDCRGLLEFADGHEPGPRGWRAIAIHSANCWGEDKLPFAEREAWFADNRARMEACAADPLGERWWTQADDPWQFLACCMAALHPESAAHLPVHQDGACNGLQHYAAMGLDEAGGASVNLIPSHRPADVYAAVARAMQDRLDPSDPLDAACLPFATRDIVKQPVMTSVYGVTAVGARGQIRRKLKDQGLSGADLSKAASRLGQVTMQCIGDVCEKASLAMDWMRQVASIVCKENHPVAWTTPLGFPVVQAYRRPKDLRCTTALYRMTLRVHWKDARVWASKQRNGFAPNLVHSIDGTHLLMTAEACEQAGIAFAGVHDSYWTHAAHYDFLASTLREKFVELHATYQLAAVRDEIEDKTGLSLPEPPERGGLDLSRVLDSPYFFH